MAIFFHSYYINLFAIQLCHFPHQYVKSTFAPLASGLALGLALTKRK